MEPIPLAKKITITADKTSEHKATAVIEPLFPGYGNTIGNALRRVLLSSLAGAAVTAVKIKGVQHEFSTIPHVKEDVLTILLHLKQLNLKIHDELPQRLTLHATGTKKVTAADFEANAQVEIVNPSLHIATLTDAKASFEIDVWVEKGRGYVPIENREQEHELGVIGVDSIFTPIQNVGYSVENTRVGKRTDFDKLLLEIQTDGTITAREAIAQAAHILVEQFQPLCAAGENAATSERSNDEESTTVEEKTT